MIEIFVASYKGISPPLELKGSFGPEGGTIGRGTDNQLVLPDPARHVSRLQARITFDGQRFLVVNVSNANPLFVNDEEIASGAELPIKPGDELRIGLYLLGIRIATPAPAHGEGPDSAAAMLPPHQAAGAGARPAMVRRPVDPLAAIGGSPSAPNPFADLLGPGVAGPSSDEMLPPQVAVEQRPAQAQPIRALDAPLHGSDHASPMPPAAPPSSDPFADLLPLNVPTRPARSSSPSRALEGTPGKPASSAEIPADFDPFAMPSSAPRNTDDPLRDLAAASIDLGSVNSDSQRSDLLEFDLAKKPDLRDPLGGGGTPSFVDSLDAVDPLQLFGGDENALINPRSDPLAGSMPMPDKVPEINAYFKPPRGIEERPIAAASAKPARSVPASPSPPAHSLPGPLGGSSSVPFSARPTPELPSTPPTGGLHSPQAPSKDPLQGTPTRSIAPQVDSSQLLAAFLKGARVPDMPVRTGLTPALMEAMGTLVYQATAGAMELIAARQITKREIRADVTIIVPQGNNPLKFLPTPEAAIMQMLGPSMPGFTSTAKAMQEVFEDLRAHEVGVIAGMRAALAEVLRRFDPAILERRLGKGGLLEALVPASRQARLWELFEQQFQEIYREAQDDYQALFGEAFIKAYEEQVQQDEKNRGRG